MTIPNMLTLFRIALIPVLVILFYMPYHWTLLAASVIFAIGAITDIVDGYIARSTGQISELGAFLDPVADKLMVVAALVMIVQDYQTWLVAIPAIIMIAREIFISALREFMSSRGKRDIIAVSEMGKYKTAAQMLGIMGLIWRPDYDIPLIFFYLPHEILNYASYGFYFLATVLTLSTLIHYFSAAWPELKLAD